MDDAPAPTDGEGRVAVRAHPALNPATVKGAVAVLLGAATLLLPDLSVTLVNLAVGIGLAVSGGTDIWFALAGRRRVRRRGSRLLALVRGIGSLLFVLVLLVLAAAGVEATLSLALLVGLVGVYLGVRGVITIVATLLRRDRPGRAVRLASGCTAIAFGVLAFAAPETTTEGLIVGAALLALVLGTILLAYGLRTHGPSGRSIDPATATIAEILWDWVRGADIGSDRRENLAETLYFEEPGRAGKLVAWWVMLALSVAIATFAILLDSTAVVIGAMLIAPLMVPILGLAGALVNGWSRRAGRSVLLLTGGIGAAIILSYALSAWAPIVVAFDTNTQITSRVDPTLLDMMVAVAAGAAGAFATVNTRVASSIAGVAIAVALVPPLAVVGISLGAQRLDDALGAFLLFLTNLVAIVLAAAVVFVLAGFAQPARLRARPSAVLVTIAPFAVLAALILVPLVFASEGLIATSTQQRAAQDVVEEWLGPDTDLQVDRVQVSTDGVEVHLTGPSEAPPIDPLQTGLGEALERPVAVSVAVAPVTLTRADLPDTSP